MKISIISLKGGVGKTFISINLSAYLGKYHNKKVLLLDLNGESSNAIIYIREKPKILDRMWKGIVIKPWFHYKLFSKIIDEDLKILERVYDYIIIDTPPNLDIIKKVSEISDIIFLILNPDFPTLYTNYYLYRKINKENLKLILNKHDKSIDIDFIEALYKKYISVVIPYDKEVKKSERHMLPLVIYNPNSKASKAFDDISYLITGKKLRYSIIDILKSIFLS